MSGHVRGPSASTDPIKRVRGATRALGLSLVVACVLVTVSGSSANADVTLIVPTQYPTIQAAVDAASPGATIRVRPGIYNEQVSIGKNVTITGAGALSTTIHAPGALVPGSLGLTSIVDIHGGATVKLSHLTVSGPGPNACAGGTLSSGIQVVENATLDLGFARVLDIHDTPIHDCPHNGNAILIGSFIPEAVGHAIIHDVVVSRFQSSGIVVFTPGSSATITRDIVDGRVDPSTVVFNTAVEVGNGAVAKVTHNVLRGSRCTSSELGCGPDPTTQFQAAGFGTGPGEPPGPGTEVAHNLISDNDIGIYLFAAGDCCDVHDNLIANNRYFGIAIQDGISDVFHNTILGGAVGVGVIADSTDSVGTLHGDRIFGTSVAKTQELECCGFTATVVIR